MNLTNEMIQKAKEAKSAQELLALAEENGVEMTEQEAIERFEALNALSGELSDDELDNVAGGGCGSKKKDNTPPSLFNVGDLVVYKLNPDRANPATVLEKKYENSAWKYKVLYREQPIGYLFEGMLEKA